MSQQTVVREAGPRDAVLLHLVAAATFPLACTPGTSPESIQAFIEEQLSVERFRSYLAEDDHVLFIAETAGTPAGYAMMRFSEITQPDVAPFLTAFPTVELAKFYLLAGRHGTGLADQLLLACIEAARRGSAASMWLGVNTENARANRFYVRHEFEGRGTKTFEVGAVIENDNIRERVL